MVFGGNCCPSVLETAGLRVLTRAIRNFNMFTPLSSYCPSARFAPEVNAVCKPTDILRNSCFNANILNWSILRFYVCVLSCVVSFLLLIICIVYIVSVIGHSLFSSAYKGGNIWIERNCGIFWAAEQLLATPSSLVMFARCHYPEICCNNPYPHILSF
jgi:hypothetical protein